LPHCSLLIGVTMYWYRSSLHAYCISQVVQTLLSKHCNKKPKYVLGSGVYVSFRQHVSFLSFGIFMIFWWE
jgi:hypothetical protein